MWIASSLPDVDSAVGTVYPIPDGATAFQIDLSEMASAEKPHGHLTVQFFRGELAEAADLKPKN